MRRICVCAFNACVCSLCVFNVCVCPMCVCQMFNKDGCAWAFQWLAASGAWVEIGQVTGSAGGETLNGKKYDKVSALTPSVLHSFAAATARHIAAKPRARVLQSQSAVVQWCTCALVYDGDRGEYMQMNTHARMPLLMHLLVCGFV